MNIKPIDMRFIDQLFEMEQGYVLDFSNRTFSEFFRYELGLNIDHTRYSSNGSSKAKRLRTLLQTGSKETVIKTLHSLWEYREKIHSRANRQEKLPNARDELFSIIQRLKGTSASQRTSAVSTDTSTAHSKRISKLAEDFKDLLHIAPQPRGYAFEKFLRDLFNAHGLEARDAFRLVGEQIDGSFQLGNDTYLLEAKWQDALSDAACLRAFQGKVEDKSAWARGLFVSYGGYSEPGLLAFRGKRIILMDGLDLDDTLRRRLSVADVIARKVRRAAETGKIFVRVRDLVPE
jgi:hypothetical protein